MILDSPNENNNDDLVAISKDIMDNEMSLASLPAEIADNSLLNSEGK